MILEGEDTKEKKKTYRKQVEMSDIDAIIQKTDSEIEHLQSKIYDTVFMTLPRYLENESDRRILAERLSSIRRETCELEENLQSFEDSADNVVAFCKQIESSKNHLKNLNYTWALLSDIDKLERTLQSFNSSLESYNLDISADTWLDAKKLVELIIPRLTGLVEGEQSQGNQESMNKKDSFDLPKDEIFLAKYLEFKVTDGKCELECRLDELFKEAYKFFGQGIEVSAIICISSNNRRSSHTISLEQMWHALRVTSKASKKLEELITLISRTIIDKVINETENISLKNVLVSHTFCTEPSCKQSMGNNGNEEENQTNTSHAPKCGESEFNKCFTWLWMSKEKPLNDKDEDCPKTARPLKLLLETLENLLEFITKNFFPGHPDVLDNFRKLFWPDLVKYLESYIHSREISEYALERLKKFETKIKGIQLIPFDDGSLSKFWTCFHKISSQSKKLKALSRVKELSYSVDPVVIPVGGDEKTDIFLSSSRLFIETVNKDRELKKFFDEKFLQYLEESPLLLPKCYVSRAAFETMEIVNEVLEDVIKRVSKNEVDESAFEFAVSTIREVVSLFFLIRVASNKKNLAQDPLFASIFFCDVLYMCRRLLLMRVTMDRKIPSYIIQSNAWKLSLFDVVNFLRPAQEEIFNTMLNYQRNLITRSCDQLGSFCDLSNDSNYLALEASVADLIQSLKSLNMTWKSTLPESLWRRCIARLLDVFLSNILGQISKEFENTYVVPDNVFSLSFLLASIKDQLDPILISDNLKAQNFTHLWRKFCLFKDLLDSDTQHLILLRKEIKELLSRDELQNLLTARGMQEASEIVGSILAD